jgi:hypothetical protein
LKGRDAIRDQKKANAALDCANGQSLNKVNAPLFQGFKPHQWRGMDHFGKYFSTMPLGLLIGIVWISCRRFLFVVTDRNLSILFGQ